MFLLRVGRFGRIGPLGLAYTGYRMWRRLSPQQKAAIRRRVGGVAGRVRRGRSSGGPGGQAPATMSRVGVATAPSEEISPGGP
ncbi:MAG TPA: hypothetical protein VFI04_00240 [Gaiellaceae bacterium]|nr:hypothetical protein [Gaiellaceae bacterium]